jgi:hypothetical protein
MQQTPTFDTISVEIRYILAHVGVPGYETAKIEEKLAATGAVVGIQRDRWIPGEEDLR